MVSIARTQFYPHIKAKNRSTFTHRNLHQKNSFQSFAFLPLKCDCKRDSFLFSQAPYKVLTSFAKTSKNNQPFKTRKQLSKHVTMSAKQCCRFCLRAPIVEFIVKHYFMSSCSFACHHHWTMSFSQNFDSNDLETYDPSGPSGQFIFCPQFCASFCVSWILVSNILWKAPTSSCGAPAQ